MPLTTRSSSQEIALGTATFAVYPTTAVPDVYDITLSQGTVTKTATLTVTQAAALTEDEINIVTAGDSLGDFGYGTDGGTTLVRVDQNTVRFDFDAADTEAGASVRPLGRRLRRRDLRR